MKADLPFVLKTFSKFNDMCFGGELPPVDVALTSARTFLGRVTYVRKRNLFGTVKRNENICMRISTAFDLAEPELEDVVLHEMIHYYIVLHNIKDTSSHGEVFRRMMISFNSRFGRHISISHRTRKGAPSPLQDVCRTNWLCVTQLQDEQWGITSCAGTRVVEIYRKLPRFYRLNSIELYSCTDPFFNRYPRSIKPHIYRISREELDAHLSDATQLKCDGHTIKPAR